MRHLLVAAVAAVAVIAAGSAGAATYRPAANGLAFIPLKTSGNQAPSCFNQPVCLSPQMVQDAYDFPNGRSAPTGAGQVIVVVNAYGSPFLGADVAAFEQAYNLPATDLELLPQQTVLAPLGSDDFLNWALETTLDVEWTHATAPGAKIVLAVAANDDTSNLVQVAREALAKYPRAILSLSFGGDEVGPFSDPDAMSALDRLFVQSALRGGTVVTAAGDFGGSNGNPTVTASYPASSPLTLAVGGTMGDPYPGGLWNKGKYGGEQVWNEVLDGFPGASGGAPSVVYPRPIWQTGFVQSAGRGVADVAYNAAANGGVAIRFGGSWGAIGGTSAGAPQWAGLVALANEARAGAGRGPVGLVAPLLYQLARDRSTYRQDFHDIASGTNALFGAGSPFPGFAAGVGYDYPTGLGTPDVARLLKDLSGRDSGFGQFDDLQVEHGHRGPGQHGRFAPGR